MWMCSSKAMRRALTYLGCMWLPESRFVFLLLPPGILFGEVLGCGRAWVHACWVQEEVVSEGHLIKVWSQIFIWHWLQRSFSYPKGAGSWKLTRKYKAPSLERVSAGKSFWWDLLKDVEERKLSDFLNILGVYPTDLHSGSTSDFRETALKSQGFGFLQLPSAQTARKRKQTLMLSPCCLIAKTLAVGWKQTGQDSKDIQESMGKWVQQGKRASSEE